MEVVNRKMGIPSLGAFYIANCNYKING